MTRMPRAGFDPAHRRQLLDKMGELAAEARALGAGLWIGEYGGMAEASGIVEYMTAQYDAAGMGARGAGAQLSGGVRGRVQRLRV